MATLQHWQPKATYEVRSGAASVFEGLNEMDHITMPTQQAPPSTQHFP